MKSKPNTYPTWCHFAIFHFTYPNKEKIEREILEAQPDFDMGYFNGLETEYNRWFGKRGEKEDELTDYTEKEVFETSEPQNMASNLLENTSKPQNLTSSLLENTSELKSSVATGTIKPKKVLKTVTPRKIEIRINNRTANKDHIFKNTDKLQKIKPKIKPISEETKDLQSEIKKWKYYLRIHSSCLRLPEFKTPGQNQESSEDTWTDE